MRWKKNNICYYLSLSLIAHLLVFFVFLSHKDNLRFVPFGGIYKTQRQLSVELSEDMHGYAEEKNGQNKKANLQTAPMGEETEKESYQSNILGIINGNKRYPDEALQNGEEGRVKIRFTIVKNGNLKGDVEIVETSGKKYFDREATGSVYSSVPFPSIPDDFNIDEMTFAIEVTFYMKKAY